MKYDYKKCKAYLQCGDYVYDEENKIMHFQHPYKSDKPCDLEEIVKALNSGNCSKLTMFEYGLAKELNKNVMATKIDIPQRVLTILLNLTILIVIGSISGFLISIIDNVYLKVFIGAIFIALTIWGKL